MRVRMLAAGKKKAVSNAKQTNKKSDFVMRGAAFSEAALRSPVYARAG